MSDVKWGRVEDGEYNEQTAKVGQHVVTLWSDRDGERWEYQVDDGGGDGRSAPVHVCDATNEYAARREAEKEVARW